MRHPILSLVH